MEKGYCYNKDGLCEEDYCRCHVSESREKDILISLASAGRKWATWRLLNDFGIDGDGVMPSVGSAPR